MESLGLRRKTLKGAIETRWLRSVANISVLEELPGKVEGCDTVTFSMRGVSSVDVSAVQKPPPSILTQLKEGDYHLPACPRHRC